jgi:hypothetical protein
MSRLSAAVLLSIMAAGCMEPRVYQFDFSQAPGFQWDGKVKITKRPEWRLGPFLIIEELWKVERVEFGSTDGRFACIDTRGGGESPVAMVEPNTPVCLTIPGAEVYRNGIISSAFNLAARSAKAQMYRAAMQPVGQVLPQTGAGKLTTRRVSAELKPYAQHADQLTVADWCAIASEHADDVTVEFRVPDEKLRIVLHGNARQYGLSGLEVWTADGRLLKRFELKQLKQTTTKSVRPDRPTSQPQPAASRPG